MEVKNKTPESSEKDPKEDTFGEEEAEEEEDGNGIKKLMKDSFEGKLSLFYSRWSDMKLNEKKQFKFGHWAF